MWIKCLYIYLSFLKKKKLITTIYMICINCRCMEYWLNTLHARHTAYTILTCRRLRSIYLFWFRLFDSKYSNKHLKVKGEVASPVFFNSSHQSNPIFGMTVTLRPAWSLSYLTISFLENSLVLGSNGVLIVN